MPEGTSVHRCVDKVKKEKPIGNAIAICQDATGESYATGKQIKKSYKGRPVYSVEGVDGNWTLYELGGLRATSREFRSKVEAERWAKHNGWQVIEAKSVNSAKESYKAKGSNYSTTLVWKPIEWPWDASLTKFKYDDGHITYMWEAYNRETGERASSEELVGDENYARRHFSNFARQHKSVKSADSTTESYEAADSASSETEDIAQENTAERISRRKVFPPRIKSSRLYQSKRCKRGANCKCAKCASS